MFKSITVIFAAIAIFSGIIWITSHKMVCTNYQVVEKIEPYQKVVSTTKSTYINGKYNDLPATTSETWHYVYLKDGSIQDVEYLDNKTRVGNEICSRWEWKEK